MSDIDYSRLLCAESHDLFDAGGSDTDDPNAILHLPDPISIRIPEITEEIFDLMLAREKEYLPKEDYLRRLRNGGLEINFRKEASDWIWKAHSHYCYGPLSFCLSMNYLDRFLSLYDLNNGKAWAVQLLAVACLSIAIKMEETNVPPTLELQVGSPKFMFEAKTIKRMELLVLSTLKWHMNALTPCSFVEPYLSKLYDHKPVPMIMIDRSVSLILAALRGLEFLRFKPSEVAAAVAISVAGETQPVSIDKLVSSSCPHIHKNRVSECIELVKDMSLMSASLEMGNGGEESPNAVLEVRLFTHKSDDDVANSSQGSLDNKRKRNHNFQ